MNQHRSPTGGNALLPVLAILAGLAACDRQGTAPEAMEPEAPSAAEVSSTSAEEELLAVSFFSDYLWTVDPATGDGTRVGSSGHGIDLFHALAIRPSDGTLFGWDNQFDVRGLLTIDRATGEASVVDQKGLTDHPMGGLAFLPDGRLIGLESYYSGAAVVEIDPETGAVGADLISLEYGIGGADVAPDGTLYAVDAINRLLTLDLSAGTVSVIGTLTEGGIPYGEEVNVLSIAFDGDGELHGANFEFTDAGIVTRLFSIDPVTAEVTNVRDLEPRAASGMVFAPVAAANAAPTADANGPYTGQEGSPVAFDGTGSSDPEGGALTYAWTFGDGSSGSGATPSHTYADDGSYIVELTVEDPEGATDTDAAEVTIANVAPTVNSVSGPTDPVSVETAVAVTASFTDPGVLDTHTATISWGDGSSSSATVSESAGSGTATASHAYASAGVYTVTVNVADDDGGTASGVYEYVVVYDPDAGFVTGGGWIDSPAGAYAADPTTIGKASFGFVSRYRNGAVTPSGNTQFQFRAGDLTFHSSAYDWLVIAGNRGQYKGTGTVNGEPGYGFMLVGIDGDLPGGDGTDRFRIKIWELDTESVVYDNQMGEDPDSDAATALGGGSIVIHGG